MAVPGLALQAGGLDGCRGATAQLTSIVPPMRNGKEVASERDIPLFDFLCDGQGSGFGLVPIPPGMTEKSCPLPVVTLSTFHTTY